MKKNIAIVIKRNIPGTGICRLQRHQRAKHIERDVHVVILKRKLTGRLWMNGGPEIEGRPSIKAV